jgi:predicted nucleic acid-binding protein
LKVYADSSFLASLYTLDSHSARAAADVLRYNPKLMLTPLAELELTNALELRVFRKELSAAMIGEARAELQNHVNEGFYDVVGMPATAYDLARRIALRRTAATGTRTLDILHVASAVLLRAEEFWTFDARQAKVAKAEGLQLR